MSETATRDVLIVNHHLYCADLALKDAAFGDFLPEAAVTHYTRTVVLPGCTSLTDAQAAAIRGYLEHGGRVIATGELGYHVLDVMLSAQESAADGQTRTIESTVAPVPLLPDGFDPFAETL